MSEIVDKYLTKEQQAKALSKAPLVLIVAAMLLSFNAIWAESKYGTEIGITVHKLVEDQEDLDFQFTTSTSETLPEENFCTVHTLGKTYQLHFEIANTTAQLAPYYDQFELRFRIMDEDGSGWSQVVMAIYDGTTLEHGFIQMPADYTDFVVLSRVYYESKGVTGSMKIAVNIWAEG